MGKLLRFLFLFNLILLTACTQTEEAIKESKSKHKEELQKLTEELNDKEDQIKELSNSNKELNDKIDHFIQEKEVFPVISNLSKEFINAHSSGDKVKLQQLLSEKVVLVEKENKLFAKINGNDFEWLLFDSQSKIKLDDWVIQGYQYDNETDTYSVHIREFYSDINGKSVSPPTFLSLTLKHQENEWIIISLAFDV